MVWDVETLARQPTSSINRVGTCKELCVMKSILAAIGFLTLAVSPASAFYQQTVIFQKALFVTAEEACECEAGKTVEKEKHAVKKWRIAFTNPMS